MTNNRVTPASVSIAKAHISDRVRPYRELFHAIEDLRTEMKRERRHERSLKRRLVAAGLIAIVLGGGLVAALSATTTTFYGMSGETMSIDTSVMTLTTGGHSVAQVAAVAAGTTNSFVGAVELAPANAASANTVLVLGQWTYQVTLAETGVNSFAQSATAYYKVELFLDGVSQGSLYLKNAVGDIVSAEGVVVKWNLGASLPDSGAYVVKVTRMAA